MSTMILSLEVRDIRFPTSRSLDGSDAMNPDPDYSAAYVVLRTDADDGLEGHGLTFTIGRGNEVVRRGDRARSRRSSSGATLEEIVADMRGFWRQPHQRQPAALARAREGRDPPRDRGGRERGLGPLGQGRGQAAVAAARRPDARADRRVRRLPLPHRRAHARRGARPPRARRADGRERAARDCSRDGYPAYTTSAGWLGYDDDKIAAARARGASPTGWTHFKMKVGRDLEDDVRRRAALIREEIGPGRRADDGRQPGVGRRRGDRVDAALARVRPVVDRGADEPGRRARPRAHRARVAPIGVATGEHVQNRVIFKQLLPGRGDRRTARSTRAGSAASTRCSRCCCWPRSSACRCARTPAASGCASTCSTSSIFDYVCVSGSLDDRIIEYVDHLHEHFVDPAVVETAATSRRRARLQHRDAAGIPRPLRVSGRRRLVRCACDPRRLSARCG